ncbi:MAG TPA: sigma-70 family RNA polymerase sigma factor [Gemmataceae bacterium]|jgi:RNA polymerase sigma-70 factor (ECF subfamily)|nr:sigma-70 family RNA polymerase sigma factor [Gemmataceae bacterium]
MTEAQNEFLALVERVRQGDQEALAQLIQQYEPELRLAAHFRLGSSLRRFMDSMDLVQSVHHSLMMGLRQQKFDVTTPEKLLALAGIILKRKIALHWKRLKFQQNLDAGSDETREVDKVLAEKEDPAKLAQVRDQISFLCRTLNATERRLVELRLLGYSTAEVAREMGIAPDPLRVALARLRTRLRATGLLKDWI